MKSNLKIYVIGYFEHANIGDESYKLTFEYFFKKHLVDCNYKLNFINCDKLELYTFEDSDIIILGGGDVLNNYFLDELILKFNGKPNKIIGVSVGLPYINILKTNKLEILDYIFIRSEQDLSLFNKFFDKTRIKYISDFSVYLKQIPLTKSKTYSIVKNVIKKIDRKIICISLNRHVYIKDKLNNYNQVIDVFEKFTRYLITFGFFVIFVPYNTNNLENENDILIHNDIINKIKYNNPRLLDNIINIDFTINGNEILDLYKYSYTNVVMRFHACLFSIYSEIPMLPVFTTRKIKNLLLDTHWNYGYELDTDTEGIPINIDIRILISRFGSLINLYTLLCNKLCNINKMLDKCDNEKYLIDIIRTDYVKLKLVKDKSDLDVAELHNKLNKIAGVNDFRLITDQDLQNILVKVANYHITGKTDSIYTYGLLTKMFKYNFNYKEEFKWIIGDYIPIKEVYSNPNGLFNLSYIDQKDYSGAHRSGWEYVYENIKYLNNNESNLHLDLYVDRNFHWNKQINKALDIIPYTKNWCGFIHHTFDTTFSEYNCVNLLKNTDFIESLKFCKGIFVLSEYLRNQFYDEFKKMDIKNVPIYILMHPTETPELKFTMEKWLFNKDKKIINIGGWLRNIFTFYNLSLPQIFNFKDNFYSSIGKFGTIRKVGLKGFNMNNYYPTDNFINDLIKNLSSCNTCISQNICQNISQNVSQNVSCSDQIRNNWYKHYIKFTQDLIDSVEIIEKLENDDYDKLLSENIVFINLVDASAVNTVIECIVRNTPIIVNKHPAILEMLGEKYPLYYENCINYFEINTQVCNLLTNTSNIKKAHNYLQKLDKSSYLINTFVTNFTNYLQETLPLCSQK